MALPAENTKKSADAGTKTKETSPAKTRSRTRTITDEQVTETQASDTRARIPRSPTKRDPPRAPSRPKPTTEIGTGPDPETPTRAPPFQLEEYSDMESEHSDDSNALENDENSVLDGLQSVVEIMQTMANFEDKGMENNAIQKVKRAMELVSRGQEKYERAQRHIESMAVEIEELKEAAKTMEEAKPTMERDIAEIKAMLKGTTSSSAMAPSRTYAQTAAALPTQGQADVSRQIARGEQAEKLKRHREKSEVALTLKTADPSFAKDMEALPLNAMANSIEEAANVWLKGKGEGPIKIATIRKLGKTVIIACDTEEEAKRLKGLKWEAVLGGAALLKPTFRIVVHGASKWAIKEPFQSEEGLETVNRLDEGSILAVEPLLRKPNDPESPTSSVIITFGASQHANRFLKHGIYVGKRYHKPRRYMPQCQITKCFNCQGYGHRAANCTRPTKCGRCSKNHETKGCEEVTAKCAQCNGSHRAWHSGCPQRAKEAAKMKALRELVPSTFHE